MRVSSRRIATHLVAAAALLPVAANAQGRIIPPIINTWYPLGPGTHWLQWNTTVTDTGTLYCKKGAKIEADPGTFIKVRGVLKAWDTDFYCPAGKWGGIEFTTSKSGESYLENCKILDAGGAGEGAAILCLGTRTVFPDPRLVGCDIIDSAGDGVRSIGARPRLTNCTISDCAGVAVRNTLGGYVYFAGASSFSGNRSDTVTFDRGGHGLIFPQVWRHPGPGIYYRVLGTVGTRPGGTITIRPGVELRMGNGVCLIADRGPINARGTAGSPIVIRGTGNWPGQWGGIFIKRGGAPSTFRYCEVRHGGGKTCCCGKAPHLAAVGATRRGGVTVQNCTFSNGGGPGIWVEDAIVGVTNSEVRNHADMGFVVLGAGQLTVQYSTIANNGRAGVYNASSDRVALTPYNDLLRNGQYEVVNMSTRNVPAQLNNWGVPPPEINRRIYDGMDAPGLGLGIVQF